MKIYFKMTTEYISIVYHYIVSIFQIFVYRINL